MPSYAFVFADCECESCGQPWGDSIATIEWGLCGPQDINGGVHYRLGDRVHWRSDFDSPPAAYVAFRGVVPMVNHGDPALTDLWLLDVHADTSGVECEGCGWRVVPLVEVRHGAFASVVAVGLDDERVSEAKARDEIDTPYSWATWRHGVSTSALKDVSAFLDAYDLSPPPAASTAPVGQPERLPEFLAEKAVRFAEIDRALIEGVRSYSLRLVCHAVAERVASDPYLMEVRVRRLALGADWPVG